MTTGDYGILWDASNMAFYHVQSKRECTIYHILIISGVQVEVVIACPYVGLGFCLVFWVVFFFFSCFVGFFFPWKCRTLDNTILLNFF